MKENSSETEDADEEDNPAYMRSGDAMLESLVSSGVPISILPCVKGHVGDRQGEGVRSGASCAVMRPVHVKVVEPAPLTIGGQVARSWS